MKKVLLAGAASLALTMAAAAAHAEDNTGFVGVNYSDLDGAYAIDVSGTMSFKVADNFVLQTDGMVGSLNPSGVGGGSTIWSPTAHVFYDKDQYKVGAFVGYENLDDQLLGNDGSVIGYGVEGRWALNDNVTVGALAGWGVLRFDGIPDVDLTAYKGDLSYFVSDHLRLDASVSQTTADWGPFSGKSTIWGVGGEWQFADKPYSFVASYTSASTDLTGAGNANTWSIGARRTFGSLKDRDRNSAPFQGMPFAFGGLNALFASIGSAIQDADNCFSSDNQEADCPNFDAVDHWLSGFDEFALCDNFDFCD